MSFLHVLGDILHVGEEAAPTVATAINPAAGAIVSLVLNSVTRTEQAGGSSSGKKSQIAQEVVPAATAIVSTVLQAKGASVHVDQAQMSNAVNSLVDGVVALLNSVQNPATQVSAAGASASTTHIGQLPNSSLPA